MHSRVHLSEDAAAVVAEMANVENITIREATNRLVLIGYNRQAALDKYNRKMKRERQRAARRRQRA